jgi:hypothetical protein
LREGDFNVSIIRRSGLLRPAFLAVAALAAGLLISPAPASAQNFFDLLFGGFRRPAPPPPPPAPGFADPNRAYPDYPDGPRSDYDPGGPSVAFCVRTCDGRYFPIRAGNPAEVCNAFCPAAQTKVFSGSKIDYAHSGDGRTYREMPNAFLYREKLVQGCTCNGKDPFGLARIDVRHDPTLRPGDIVATNKSLMQATPRPSGEVVFTPISGEMRKRLSEVKVAPSNDSEAGDDIPGYEPMKPARAAQDGLRPQLSR